MSALLLALSTVMAALFAIIVKYAHMQKMNVLAVGCVNYLTAAAAAALWLAPQWRSALSPWAVGLACIGGAMYVVAYVLILVMLERQGISLSAAVTRLAIIAPILASVIAWGERPSAIQWCGVAVGVSALALFYAPPQSWTLAHLWHEAWPLAGLFCTAGVSRICQKAFTVTCAPEQKPAFLAVWFAFAALLALVTMLLWRVRPARRDWRTGGLLGLVNASSLFVFLWTLERVPAVIYFPVNSCGSLALTALYAVGVWREQLSARAWVGVLLSMVAVVLVNIH